MLGGAKITDSVLANASEDERNWHRYKNLQDSNKERVQHTKREITETKRGFPLSSGGESKSVPAREPDDRRGNKKKCRSSALRRERMGNANDEKTKIPKSPACAGGAVS